YSEFKKLYLPYKTTIVSNVLKKQFSFEKQFKYIK
ncbi:hypothetical protein EZS27_043680, partial [termite gut metagenome]